MMDFSLLFLILSAVGLQNSAAQQSVSLHSDQVNLPENQNHHTRHYQHGFFNVTASHKRYLAKVVKPALLFLYSDVNAENFRRYERLSINVYRLCTPFSSTSSLEKCLQTVDFKQMPFAKRMASSRIF